AAAAQPQMARPAQPAPQAQPAESLAAPDYYAPSPNYYAPPPMQTQAESTPSNAEAPGPATTPSAAAVPATTPAASTPNNSSSSSSWSKPFRPIQAAFHQLNGPDVQPTPPVAPPTPPGASSVRVDGTQPSTIGPTYVEPGLYPAGAVPGQMYPGSGMQPGGC